MFASLKSSDAAKNVFKFVHKIVIEDDPAADPTASPYLAAAKRPAQPFARLPVLGRAQRPSDPQAPPIARPLQRSINPIGSRLANYGPKQYAKVTTPRDKRPFHNARSLREALTAGGFPGSLAVIPSSHPHTSFICASQDTLKHAPSAYNAFRKHCSNELPPIEISPPAEISAFCKSPDDANKVIPHLSAEIDRLSQEGCTWRPKTYFLEVMQASLHATCSRFPTAMQPENPSPQPIHRPDTVNPTPDQ